MEKLAKELCEKLKDYTAQEIIRYFIVDFDGKVGLATSLGAEDQVLTEMICKVDKLTKIFTLDTGRVFPETYDLLEKTNKHYQINIEVYFPNTGKVEEMVNKKGINLFYESIENRKECCGIRKIEPLKRALSDIDVWVTGIRKDQSVTRFFTPLVEWDEGNKVIKVNPLLKWSEKDVWAYINDNNIPYNALHDKGFPSIGCQPCTRAVKKGEDIRSGRWWWEEPEHKECGLHTKD
ncbi:MAG: phosphoadenylyl-sulfate reductase [Bacteroidales bacterium]|nr:phosphoadenylyl-sulfate reductase [Bacteroidales bacterium]MBN2819274.1 phosphoadenylyl-sulfate reductase [Bacteroidales bacterium]